MSRDGGFLARWSRRKHAAGAGALPAEPADRTPESPVLPTSGMPDDAAAANGLAATAAPGAPLPPVDSLTIESDFSPFMAREVDPGVKRAALKTLFRDERFNVMDGLDVYIDDYTKPAPIPPGWYAKMAQMAYLGDPAAGEEEKAQEREADAGMGAAHDPAAPAAAAPASLIAPAPAADLSQNDGSATAPVTLPSEPGPR